MNFDVIQLSSYVRPKVQETSGDSYVFNGPKNSFYKYIIDRYNGSPTNRAIIDSYTQFIYGKGLTSKQQSFKPIQFAMVNKLLSKKDLKAYIKDKYMFGQGALELIYQKGNLVMIKHVPKNQVLPSKMDDNGDVYSYWWSLDFDNIRKYPPVEIDSFYFSETKSGSLLYVSEEYQAGKTYFNDPSYTSGLPYAELEEEIANYCINHIKNGLSFGHVWNMNNGEPASKEVKRKIIADIKREGTGSTNANRTYINWNSDKETAITIEALEVSDAHEQYNFLSGESVQKLLIAHRVTSPILFGIKDSTGLGNNANEMESAFNELMINVIQPIQEEVLDNLGEIFGKAGYTIDLDFIPLRTINANGEAVKTNLSSHENTDDLIADALIGLGEVVDLSEWECISEKKQEGEPDLTEISLHLAYVPSNFPERNSDQDTTLFKIRYEYKGSLAPQRQFCAKMMSAGLVYRKEDIEAASKKAVNPGLGPYGSDKYNLFLYKGGANCQHFWQRNIYLKSNQDKITTAKARELLNSLDPSERKAANYEQNDPLVAKMPTDMPNHGYLN